MRAGHFHVESHGFIPIRLLGVCVRSIDGLKGIGSAERKPVWTVSYNASVTRVKGHEVQVAVSLKAVINGVPVRDPTNKGTRITGERVEVKTIYDEREYLDLLR